MVKIAVADVFLKRYLKPYVAAAILLQSFEILVDQILNDYEHKLKFDLDHITAIHKILEQTLTKYFGYKNYVFFQVMGKYLFNRFKCIFWQFGPKLKNLIKPRISKYLNDPMLRYEPFYSKYALGRPIFSNDKEFHKYLVQKLKETYQFYFVQFLQTNGNVYSPIKVQVPSPIKLKRRPAKQFPKENNFTFQFITESINRDLNSHTCRKSLHSLDKKKVSSKLYAPPISLSPIKH